MGVGIARERRRPDRNRQKGRVRGMGVRDRLTGIGMHGLGDGIIKVISLFTTATFISGDL